MQSSARALVACASLVSAALLPAPARAQVLERIEQRVIDTITSTFGELEAKDFDIRLGAGPVYTAPDAGHGTWHPVVPLFSFHYKNWFLLDETQVSSNLITSSSEWGQEGFRAGPMMKLDLGRKRLNGDDVQRLGHVAPGGEFGGFVSWGYGPARVRARLRQELTGGHGGTVLELDFKTGLFRAGKFGVGMQLQADWASHKFMQAFYGVTDAESRETHLRAFTPGSGFRAITPSIAGEYKFNAHWSAIGTVQYIHLIGDAAESPVPRTRGAGGRTNAGVFVVYNF